MKPMTTREAINHVLASELDRDSRTVYLGETVRNLGATGASRGLFDRFGPRRVIECPVSENGIFGTALGLALSGFRPIVEIYSADFALAVANEIMNDIPKWRQQQSLAGPMPVTIRGWMGSTLGLGPEHSQCMEAFFHHAPGLQIVCPGTTHDMAGLLRSAIRSDEPVLFLEHRRIYDMTGIVPDDDDAPLQIGTGELVRKGPDATIVAWAWMRHEALRAAEQLHGMGIDVTVIDPRSIKPMDFALIVKSVRETGKLVVAEEAPMTGSIGAEVIATVAEMIEHPIKVARVAMADLVHPYSPHMEKEIIPDARVIVETVRKMMAGEPTYPAMLRPWEAGLPL